MMQLSSGICRRLNEAPQEEIDQLASGQIVQLLSIKQVIPPYNSATQTNRYRVVISDGVHFFHAMLSTQLNDLVRMGEIYKNTVVIIDKVACNAMLDRRLIVIFNLHVVSRDEGKIGTPTSLLSVNSVPALADGEIASSPGASPTTSSSAAQGQPQAITGLLGREGRSACPTGRRQSHFRAQVHADASPENVQEFLKSCDLDLRHLTGVFITPRAGLFNLDRLKHVASWPPALRRDHFERHFGSTLDNIEIEVLNRQFGKLNEARRSV